MPRPWINEALYALTSREAAWVGDERVLAAGWDEHPLPRRGGDG